MITELYLGSIATSAVITAIAENKAKYKLKRKGYKYKKVDASSLATTVVGMAVPGVNLIASLASLSIATNDGKFEEMFNDLKEAEKIEKIKK